MVKEKDVLITTLNEQIDRREQSEIECFNTLQDQI
jgi:hypothetical protein